MRLTIKKLRLFNIMGYLSLVIMTLYSTGEIMEMKGLSPDRIGFGLLGIFMVIWVCSTFMEFELFKDGGVVFEFNNDEGTFVNRENEKDN